MNILQIKKRMWISVAIICKTLNDLTMDRIAKIINDPHGIGYIR